MTTVLGILIFIAAIGLVVWQRRSRRDEMFAGITPGLRPAAGQPAPRVRIGAREAPPLAVRFDPPAGLRPALAGLIAESRLETVAISATLVDLAARGWLTMRPIDADADADAKAERRMKPKDWELRAADTAPAEQLRPAEQTLLSAVFAVGPVTTLHDFRERGAGLPQTLDAVATEAQERNWFLPPPPISMVGVGAGAATLGVVLLLFGGSLAPIGLGLLVGGAVAIAGTRGLPQAVSAEGYAARTQALGFKQYLATAEAEQLRFEVGIEQFSRYLPYAMVFGVVDHWRHVFADALQAELEAGGEFNGFGWLALDNMLTTLVLVDLFTDGGLMDGFVDDFGGDGSGGDLSDSGGDAGGDAGNGFGGDAGDSGFGGFDGGGFGD